MAQGEGGDGDGRRGVVGFFFRLRTQNCSIDDQSWTALCAIAVSGRPVVDLHIVVDVLLLLLLLLLLLVRVLLARHWPHRRKQAAIVLIVIVVIAQQLDRTVIRAALCAQLLYSELLG